MSNGEVTTAAKVECDASIALIKDWKSREAPHQRLEDQIAHAVRVQMKGDPSTHRPNASFVDFVRVLSELVQVDSPLAQVAQRDERDGRTVGAHGTRVYAARNDGAKLASLKLLMQQVGRPTVSPYVAVSLVRYFSFGAVVLKGQELALYVTPSPKNNAPTLMSCTRVRNAVDFLREIVPVCDPSFALVLRILVPLSPFTKNDTWSLTDFAGADGKWTPTGALVPVVRRSDVHDGQTVSVVMMLMGDLNVYTCAKSVVGGGSGTDVSTCLPPRLARRCGGGAPAAAAHAAPDAAAAAAAHAAPAVAAAEPPAKKQKVETSDLLVSLGIWHVKADAWTGLTADEQLTHVMRATQRGAVIDLTGSSQ